MASHPNRRNGYKKGPLGHGITLSPPPDGLRPDQDRDDYAAPMIETALDAILAESVKLGWHPAEIIVAAAGWALNETLKSGRREAALRLLSDLREAIDLQGTN